LPGRRKMSVIILLTTAITGILLLATISIIELIEKRGSLSKMETRIRAMNRKIDEFLEDKK